jgi:hypothetical protein
LTSHKQTLNGGGPLQGDGAKGVKPLKLSETVTSRELVLSITKQFVRQTHQSCQEEIACRPAMTNSRAADGVKEAERRAPMGLKFDSYLPFS